MPLTIDKIKQLDIICNNLLLNMSSKKKKGKKGQDSDDDDGDFDEKGTDYDFKIILVGTAEVGKTSITNRYVND